MDRFLLLGVLGTNILLCALTATTLFESQRADRRRQYNEEQTREIGRMLAPRDPSTRETTAGNSPARDEQGH